MCVTRTTAVLTRCCHGVHIRSGTSANRIVTIEGPPMCAQTAHTLVLQKVRQEMTEKQRD
jgi:hypothetical protein